MEGERRKTKEWEGGEKKGKMKGVFADTMKHFQLKKT